MEDELVSITTAQVAKTKGFNENTPFYFRQYEDDAPLPGGLHTNGVNTWNEDDVLGEIIYWSRPTQSLLQRWLRDQHELHILIHDDRVGAWVSCIRDLRWDKKRDGNWAPPLNTFEEALEQALQNALHLVSNLSNLSTTT